MKPGTEPGQRLTLADKRTIRAELVQVARQTGTRAFSFRYDGDVLVEFRAFPDGKCVVSKVTEAGVSVEPQRRVTLAGVSARVVTAVVVAVLLVLVFAASSRAASTLYISPSGADTNACTLDLPCRTVSRANTAALSGDTVVVKAGVYGATGTTTTFSKGGVAWQGEGKPELRGYHSATGAGASFKGLYFHGPTGNVGGNGTGGNSRLLDVRAGNIRVEGNEFFDSDGHACVYVGSEGASGIVIERNYMHECGAYQDPAQANLDHCIYANNPVGVRIANNLLERCFAHGIQLYPGGSDAVVVNNTISDAGRNGILNNGNARARMHNNVIVGSGWNSTSSSHWYAIRQSSGTGAEARNNVFWGNRENATTGTLGTSANLVADPLLIGLRPQAGSAAIGWALAAWAPLADYDGTVRDSSPDAGAVEYVAPAPVPEPTATPTGC